MALEGVAAVPVVNVRDFDTAVGFYVESLGFSKEFQFGRYAGVRLGAATIHLNGGADRWNACPTSVRVTIVGIDDLYRRLNEPALVKEDEHLQETPFGHRQFSVLDPSQNRVTFVQFGA